MNQTWENGEIPNFRPNFGPNLDPQMFFVDLPLLDIRHCCKLSLCAISRENYKINLRKWQKKLSFGPDFGPFDLNLRPKCFFSLDIVASYHCMQFQGKLIKQTWENCKKPSFKPDFGPFGPNLGPNFIYLFIFFLKNLAPSVTRYHCQLSSCTILEKNNDPILRKRSDERTYRRTDGRESVQNGKGKPATKLWQKSRWEEDL